ncbi:MAG: pantetheine-phosphate adenylyltransferase [Verrucomicrobiota bacterium]|jgi:pantetheine-phosphate adenylyltransferase|nr:pantetheine-phosphate adenylyltransferase [Verrucomicrobiota bacterium]MDK2964299.1 pantetheine-phosphate adenylyltransferase [Verrucomicrobiota bacterium]
MNKKAIYAGTFDPMTLGHLDVVERAARIFPELIVAVAGATGKKTLFSQEERVDLVRKSTRSLSSSVTVAPFEGLLVEYARSRKVTILVRGLRAFSDFEYEFQMALTNRQLAPDIETLFLMPKQDYSVLSSTNVKEIASMEGNVNEFVPPVVAEALENKFRP